MGSWWLPAVAAVVFASLPHDGAGYSGGFCMDNVPDALKGSGYAAWSGTSKANCPAGKWCPLVETNKTWEYEKSPSKSVVYYWFSACCSPVNNQGKFWIEDNGAKGWPNCRKLNDDGEPNDASTCTRRHWHEKFFHDYIAPDSSGYDKNSLATSSPVSPLKYGGYTGKSPCICKADDPNCKIKNEKGTACLVCTKATEKCSDEEVQLGINFFKLHTIDLKTSQMFFSAWLREEWFDRRLWYDYQCYGGVDYFEVQAEAGSQENSNFWVPDIELYNMDEPIWQGSVGPRGAQIYGCWNGNPTRGGCGYIFWSRPGLMKALCKYYGIVQFPFDKASCQLEFAAFSTDGRWQDLIPRKKDGGVAWLDKPGTVSVAGLTAGSKYQDYVLRDIKVERNIVFYDCCPSLPWPTLIYTVYFERSNEYYAAMLVVPGIMLVMISWIAFWMNPAIGERLGYGVMVILGMIINMVTASSLMPVCAEKVWMDYINIVSLCFGALAILETGVVLHLYFQDGDTWAEVAIPRSIRIWWWKFVYGRHLKGSKKTHHRTHPQKKDNPEAAKKAQRRGSAVATAADTEEMLVRKQVYRQIFYVLDDTHNMLLDLEEIEEFGQIMTAGQFSIPAAMEFMKAHDKNFDGVLDLEEFVNFCEGHLVRATSLVRFKQITQGFLEVIDRKRASKIHMWQRRAMQIDTFARWLIPIGFGIFMIILCTNDLNELLSMELDKSKQYPLFVAGFIPVLAAIVIYAIYGCFWACYGQKKAGFSNGPLVAGFRSFFSRGKSDLSQGIAGMSKDGDPR